MATSTATQQFVPIEHIRDGIITMKGGELRSVLITNSLNLGLKSEEEQQAVLMQFQSLLNGLEFPVQFFIQSRRLNIKPYLDMLEERQTHVKEDLLRIQIREYMGFIKKFTDETNIMTKHFFIVVPYLNTSLKTSQGSSLLPFGENSMKENEELFNASRIQLEQRVASVMSSLARIGLRAQKLGTEETVELFYKLFNPGEQDRSMPAGVTES
jgi:type IV secretory pathway VirB4 component